uniref:Putative secreted protein n=1 Tax=Ixodes ricinus TaxID=34613 RepID=A0A6B0UG27_IXORI
MMQKPHFLPEEPRSRFFALLVVVLRASPADGGCTGPLSSLSAGEATRSGAGPLVARGASDPTLVAPLCGGMVSRAASRSPAAARSSSS